MMRSEKRPINFAVDKETYNKYDDGLHLEERRLRFSAAHELGHYMLHADELRSIEHGPSPIC